VSRPPELTRIEVAAGILRDGDGSVLLAERAGDAAFAGLWEFPGGKLDPGERPEEALGRELREELGILIDRHRHLLSLDHDYPDRAVRLHFYLVEQWLGPVAAVTGQRLRWVRLDALEESELLPADAPVIEVLRGLWAVSADAELKGHVMPRLNRTPVDR
jgi:8-oxo-dGTP diphosphatase